MKQFLRNFLVVVLLCGLFTVAFSGKSNNVSARAGSASDNAVQPSVTSNDVENHFEEKEGKSFWYEDGKLQGAYGDPKNIKDENYGGQERGREIYDAASDGWYWLDANANGAKAVSKEVWMPYIYQDEAKWDDARKEKESKASNKGLEKQVYDAMKNKDGKWVRYDANGKMYKGWTKLENWEEKPEQNGNVYYYDTKTGLMAKGKTTIDGKEYNFDKVTGVCKNPPAKYK